MKTIERHNYQGNKIIQTRRITFEPYRFCEYNMCLAMGLIQRNLTPELLARKKLKYRDSNNKYYGHCYHSSQALSYLMDTNELISMSAEDYRGEKHWWLQYDDRVYDCTAEQYYMVGKFPPYSNGKKSRWYGWKQRPQQISINLTVKVLGDRLVEDKIIS